MKKDKERDIARGVLPSTARRSARENKRDIKHTHRRNQAQICHEIVRSTTVIDDDGHLYTDPDLFDDFEPRHVIDGYHATTKKEGLGYDDMKDVVARRRDHDKLGPLLSWARGTERQKMQGWSVEDKYAYFKAVLPDTLQGRHALGHVETALDLQNDDFYWLFRYSRRPAPVTKEQFRAALAKILSTSKGRTDLHEFILATVPVAAHKTEAANKKRATVEARDENGNIRYHEDRALYHNPAFRKTPMMVNVYVPQIVATTCADCSFLRNDPLATTFAVNTFVDLVWRDEPKYYWRRETPTGAHACFYKVRQYIIDSREP